MIYQPEAAVRKEEKRKSNWWKINVGPALSRLNLAGEEGRCWPWISWWEPPRPAWWSARPPAPARWGPGGRRPSRRGPRWSRGWSRRTGRRRRWWGGEWESEKSENIFCSQQIFSQQLLVWNQTDRKTRHLYSPELCWDRENFLCLRRGKVNVGYSEIWTSPVHGEGTREGLKSDESHWYSAP